MKPCIPQCTTFLTAKAQKQYTSAEAVEVEVLSSIRTVVALGGEQKEVERWAALGEDLGEIISCVLLGSCSV